MKVHRVVRLALGLAVSLVTGISVAAKLFVANEGSNNLTVVDAVSYKVLATVPVGRDPHNVQVSPDGKRAWVTSEGEARQGAGDHKGGHEAQAERGALWAVDTETYAVVAKIPVGRHPAHVVLAPDGRRAYVTNGGDNTLSVVDVQAGNTVRTIPVGEFPHGLRISPDGREAYVANLKGGSVSVLDTVTMTEVARLSVGRAPAQTGFAPDGRTAFVSLSGEDRVALIDRVSRKVVSKVAVGSGPIQVHASLDGRWLLVANQGTRQRPGTTVSVIDLGSGQVVRTLTTGRGAHGVAVGADGSRAFVTNIYQNTVSVIDLAAMKVVASVAVGKEPNGISVQP